ncbi:MAG: hypothetical protein K0S37_4565 [Microbacterium sp.]|nr:hypothetical protein [Microbacterium sp.]
MPEPGFPAIHETVPGSVRPVSYHLAPTWDGLYVPYALRVPSQDGTGFPFVFLAYGNGGGGLEWLRERVTTHGYIMERLLDAGYACAWGRYRTEVELGFHQGGRLIVDRRQGMDLMSRSPLEFEDELAILEHVAGHPQIDPDRLGHLGVSHAGEMLFKIASQYDGPLKAGVACEPANHEFLDLTPDDSAFTNPATQLRNIEEMQMRDPAFVRSRINEPLALERIAPISLPILVMGRDDDHLQGIFRLSYDLLEASGKDASWVSWNHPLHGYVFPVTGADGRVEIDDVQERAIDGVIDFFDRRLAGSRR